MYILINKNLLLIEKIEFNSLMDALYLLQELVYGKNESYYTNVYVLQLKNENELETITSLYSSDGKNIYKKNFLNNTINKVFYSKIVDNKQLLVSIDEFILNIEQEEKDNDINIKIKDTNTTHITENEDTIQITNIKGGNKDTEDTEEIRLKQELLDKCNEVMEIYQKELANIKKMELTTKTFNNKINKLEKRKREIILNTIIKVQSEYRTWKNIKYKIKKTDDILTPINKLEMDTKTIPIMFLSKYNYLDKIQQNEEIKQILEEINIINLDQVYSDDSEIENKITEFANNYAKLSNDLRYNFDNDWDYLLGEMNVNSTNKIN